MRLLKEQLDGESILVPERSTSTGRKMGGVPFTRGQIYKILSNPIYRGEIEHKGSTYKGQHEAIIERELWDKVQSKLADNVQGQQQAATVRAPSLLAGRVFDEAGEPLVASHACKGKVRYRYYVSRSLQHEGGSDASHPGLRIPAREIEGAVVKRLVEALEDPLQLMAASGVPLAPHDVRRTTAAASELGASVSKKDLQLVRSLVSKVQVLAHEIRIGLAREELFRAVDLPNDPGGQEEIILTSPIHLTRTGSAVRLLHANGQAAAQQTPNEPMVRLLAKARQWWARLADGTTDIAALARKEGVQDAYVSRVVRLNFLAPELVEAILAGKQRADLDARKLTLSGPLPISWEQQIQRFG